jgi:hypothetical protein
MQTASLAPFGDLDRDGDGTYPEKGGEMPDPLAGLECQQRQPQR